ncbi:MAG: tetratricopeptide repeat protein [Desulfuromonadaceae bacterium]
MRAKYLFIVGILIFTSTILGCDFETECECIEQSKEERSLILIALEKKDYRQAADLLLSSANSGNHFSQWAYGELLQVGLVPDGKPEQADDWYQKAADRGYRPALVALHMVSPALGDFQNMNVPEARLLFIRAVGGDSDACSDLASWLYDHAEMKQARYWLIQSTINTDKDNVIGRYNSASILFSKGYGQDQRKAISIMRELASNGFGLYELGEMLEKADGTLRNTWEAADWYRRAAEAGNSKAQLRLGAMYFEGDLIGIRSEYEALRWFKKAAKPRKNERGYSYIPAESRLKLLYYLGRGLGGFHGSMEASGISESELGFLAGNSGNFETLYYVTAIGLRNSHFDYVFNEAKTAAKDGEQHCYDTECFSNLSWFQLLSGQSHKLLNNAQRLSTGNAKSHFHLGHALLLNDRTAEALEQYDKGLAIATLHERYLLDDELDLLSWHFSKKHSLMAAARLTLNEQHPLFAEETIKKHESVKALKASMVTGGLIKEANP